MLDFVTHPERLPFLISWEAWSTLAVGILAVIGAVKVGLEQTRITKRQTEILGRQVELEATKLRVELYDRRHAVYEAAENFILAAMKSDWELPQEVYDGMSVAVRQSRFLFDNDFQDLLRKIQYTAFHIQSVASSANGEAQSEQASESNRQDLLFRIRAELTALHIDFYTVASRYLGLLETPNGEPA